MSVDFVGNPKPQIYVPRVFNKVMNCNSTNQLAIKLLHYQPQDFDNPQIMAPTNKNDSTVFSTFSYLNLLSAHFKLLFE